VTPGRLRVLCLLDHVPVPPDRGRRQRCYNLLRALEDVGEVDLFVGENLDNSQQALLRNAVPLTRLGWAAPRVLRWSRTVSLRWLLSDHRPRRFGERDLTPLRAAFTATMAPPYDVVLSEGQYLLNTVTDLAGGPVVFDLSFLTYVVQERAAEVQANLSLRRRLRERVDRVRWRRAEQAIPGQVALVIVASEIDRVRLGAPNVAVVPNGYDAPAHPCGHPDTIGTPPTLLFQGHMDSRQNVDATEFFVNQVFPLVRRSLPDVRLRIVGRPAPRVQALADRPGVTVVGYVDVIEDELGRADAVVVPLRLGSGTRLKILESWAHRLPVVSTRVGAEGLAGVDGEHLLLADEPPSLAEACGRVLTDRALRVRLADGGQSLFRARYEWPALRATLAELVRAVAAGRR
jgi:glycosyltransferase involved in cell wall biosynthesis